ncbi:MAG: ABC transporter ATP-binding protein, partial [Finegoldia magna]|nr:ABC transporter ATP-binding protein [Finegoldia magna]
MEINDGECVAFIGASGCGKTTLTRLINGLAYKFYGGKLKGEISIDGINPLEKELYEIGRKVGSIFQNPKSQFFAENVEDEIAFGLENYGIEREKIDEIINNSLKSINGEDLKDKNLFHLSSGERQKIAIASINALNPPIYVFDEPSANLDMKSVEALRKLILLLKKNKKTIIISEHRLYYLRGVVDKYYYLENGEISNVFTEEELLSKSEDFFNKLGLRFFSLNKISPKINKLKEINSMNLEKISFSYNKNVLIKDLTYEFKSGNIYGIIGDNGIGKSTLFKILSGLMKKDSGFISINGEKLNKRNRQKRIYYLSNNPDSNLFEVSAEDELKLNNKDTDTDK